jgi:steroid 5-alpha reductase family enzyme
MVDTPVGLLILSAGGVVVAFGLLWLEEVRTDDASLVDVGWALALGGVSTLYSVLGSGTLERSRSAVPHIDIFGASRHRARSGKVWHKPTLSTSSSQT